MAQVAELAEPIFQLDLLSTALSHHLQPELCLKLSWPFKQSQKSNCGGKHLPVLCFEIHIKSGDQGVAVHAEGWRKGIDVPDVWLEHLWLKVLCPGFLC